MLLMFWFADILGVVGVCVGLVSSLAVLLLLERELGFGCVLWVLDCF